MTPQYKCSYGQQDASINDWPEEITAGSQHAAVAGEGLVPHRDAEVEEQTPLPEAPQHTQDLLPVGLGHHQHGASLRHPVAERPGPRAAPAYSPVASASHGSRVWLERKWSVGVDRGWGSGSLTAEVSVQMQREGPGGCFKTWDAACISPAQATLCARGGGFKK